VLAGESWHGEKQNAPTAGESTGAANK